MTKIVPWSKKKLKLRRKRKKRVKRRKNRQSRLWKKPKWEIILTQKIKNKQQIKHLRIISTNQRVNFTLKMKKSKNQRKKNTNKNKN